MSVFRTAYDTLACNGFQMKKTIDALKINLFSSSQMRFASEHVMSLEGGSTLQDAVPAFIHPIDLSLVDEKTFPDAATVIVDFRPYGRWDPTEHKMIVRNQTDYNVAVARGKLSGLWLDESKQLVLKNLSPILMATYASWISENMARRYDLDGRQQLDLAILSAYFYSSLFSNAKDLDDADKNRLVPAIVKATRASAEDVFKILDQIPVMENVQQFATACMEVTGSTRLHNFNAGILFGILQNTWFCPNKEEIIAVAVEHPPTWISIMLAAATERGFKRTQITGIVERPYNRENVRSFVLSAKRLLNLDHIGTGT